MDLPRINGIAQKLMVNRKAHLERERGAIYYHGQSVASTVLKLRSSVLPNFSNDDEVLTVAAWFHDVAKGIEPHGIYGAAITKQALNSLVTPQELNRICSLVRLHDIRKPHHSGYTDTLKLLQDADLIDHFGTYDIWMTIQYSARNERSAADTVKSYEYNFPKHCRRNRELINFEKSREIFDEKCAYEMEFFSRLKSEFHCSTQESSNNIHIKKL